MNRRAFLTRVAQLTAGAVSAAALPALLKGKTPASLEHALNISEIEKDLEYMWANYQATPTAIYMSEDVYEQLAKEFGAPADSQMIECMAIRVIRHKYLPANTVWKEFNPAPPTAFHQERFFSPPRLEQFAGGNVRT